MKHPVVEIAEAHKELLCEEFLEWLPDNIHIWDAFVDEAIKVYRRGFRHYSARTIVHFLRHHTASREAGGEWKINNNHSPYLARLFDVMFPEYVGLWSYRETPKVKREQQEQEFA